jgi:hypothetical protein
MTHDVVEKREKKYRVQLDFSEEAFEELNKLQKKLDSSSRADVVRNALGVLRWVIKHVDEGDKIFTERSDGSRTEVEFPFLSR